MTITNPNCPECNVELDFDERLSEEIDIVRRDDDYCVKEICKGHCPNCNKHYTWNALYSFAYNEELESEEENDD